MKLFINERVVKSYDVAVSAPRMLECNEGFQQLGPLLTVLSVGEENQNSLASELLPQPANTVNSCEIEAQEKAAIILVEAENRAQEICAQALAESDCIRQEVVEIAQAEIYPKAQAEGYQAGYQAGLQVGEAEGKHLAEKGNQLFQLAQRAVQEEYAKVDDNLLQLALKIAERIVRASLAVQPKRLLAIIQALTLLPQERLGWRLHVAPDDTQWLEGDQVPCPWVVDEALNPGDCFLECQEGIFDARLVAQLDKLEHTLREELEHGNVEPIAAGGGPD